MPPEVAPDASSQTENDLPVHASHLIGYVGNTLRKDLTMPRHIVTYFIVLLASFAGATAVQAQESRPGNDPRPVLSVTGQGEVSAAPDQAIMSVGAVAQDKQAAAAQSQVNEAMQKVIAAIKDLGIADERIRTAMVSLQAVYDSSKMPVSSSRGGEPRIVGFRASNTIAVQIDQMGQIGSVIDAAMNAGANSIEGIVFQLKDDQQARQQALKKAAEIAQAKAQALAAAMNVKLGDVQTISEGGVNVIEPMYRQREMLGLAATPIQAGQVEVQANVTVQYRIAGQ